MLMPHLDACVLRDAESEPEPTPEEFRVYALLCAFAALYAPCYILYKVSNTTTTRLAHSVLVQSAVWSHGLFV
jgi:hypothetical protein